MAELTEEPETKELPLEEIINDIYKKISDIQGAIGFLLEKNNIDK